MMMFTFILVIALLTSVKGINYQKPFVKGTLPSTFKKCGPNFNSDYYEHGSGTWKSNPSLADSYYNNCPAICADIIKKEFGSDTNRVAALSNYSCNRIFPNRMDYHCQVEAEKLCASYSPEEEAERLAAGLPVKNDEC